MTSDNWNEVGAVSLVADSAFGESGSELILEKNGVRGPMPVLISNNSHTGTDAMHQITNYSASLKRLVELCRPSLIARLIPLTWRLVAAVRWFFRPGGLATRDGSVRAAAGSHCP